LFCVRQEFNIYVRVAKEKNRFYVMGLQTFYSKAPRRLLEASSRAARGKMAIRGIPNRQNYGVIFIIHTYFEMWPRAGDSSVIWKPRMCILPSAT
jgi:hypothetical protein